MKWWGRDARKEGRRWAPRGATIELHYPKTALDTSGFYKEVYAVSKFVNPRGVMTIMLGHITRDAANYIQTRDVNVTREVDA